MGGSSAPRSVDQGADTVVIAEEGPDLMICGFDERHVRRRTLDPTLSDP
jgi:hypothetical protein